MPLISVIMPCHNAESFVVSGTASVLNQTFRDLELIVVNDGSTDGTERILEGIDDPRLTIISQPKSGVSAARNRGIEAATGCYIAFLDSDVTWDLDCLEKLYKPLAVDPNIALSYCG